MDNNTKMTTNEKDGDFFSIPLAIDIIAAILSIVSLLLNGILCLAIVWKRQWHSLQKYPILPKILPFVSALAALSSLPYLFVVITNANGCKIGTVVMIGMARLGMAHLFIYVTLWIAIDRAYAVLFPMRYHAKKNVMLWPMIIGLPLPLAIMVIYPLSTRSFDEELTTCIIGLSTGSIAKWYGSIYIGITIALMILAYGIFVVKLQQNGNKMPNAARLNGTMLLLLAITIIFTFLPYASGMINNFILVGWFEKVGPLCELLTTLNQIAAFLVYNWKLPPMRNAIKQLLQAKSGSSPESSDENHNAVVHV